MAESGNLRREALGKVGDSLDEQVSQRNVLDPGYCAAFGLVVFKSLALGRIWDGLPR